MPGTRQPNLNLLEIAELESSFETSTIHLLQTLRIDSSSDISPIRFAAQFQPSSRISAVSEPDRRLWETADPLVSDSNHSRITATSQWKNSQMRITASSSPYLNTIGARRPNCSLREITDRLCQARITTESQLRYSRTTSEWNSNHSRIATASHPKHSRIRTKAQPNRSYITVDSQPLTAESQPLRNRRSNVLFQVLRNRRSTCFNRWEFADPYVSIVENSPIHMFQTLRLWEFADPCVSISDTSPIPLFQNHSRIQATSDPDHSLGEIANPLVPGSDHNRITATQDSRVTTSEKSPIHLFQAWVAAETQPHSEKSQDPLISSPDHTRITATSHSNHSCITALHSHRTLDSQHSQSTCFRHGPQRTHSLTAAQSQPKTATWNTAGPQPYHSRIIAMTGTEPKHSHIAAGTTATSQPHPNHKRITTISQPHDSRITASRNRQPTSLFQALRNRRSTYFKIWDFAENFANLINFSIVWNLFLIYSKSN